MNERCVQQNTDVIQSESRRTPAKIHGKFPRFVPPSTVARQKASDKSVDFRRFSLVCDDSQGHRLVHQRWFRSPMAQITNGSDHLFIDAELPEPPAQARGVSPAEESCHRLSTRAIVRAAKPTRDADLPGDGPKRATPPRPQRGAKRRPVSREGSEGVAFVRRTRPSAPAACRRRCRPPENR